LDGPRASISRALRRQQVIWLSSIRPDRRPHVLPVWFVWDGGSILLFSKPHAQKVRNLERDPAVMVAIGQPGLDFDVELVEGIGELEAVPTRDLMPESFVSKYCALMARGGITPDAYAAVYSQPIRIHPRRWLDWGGPGWTSRPGHPAFRDSR